MAKSLRSKWRRKCRAVKRVRYGEKELVQLKKTLGIDENTTNNEAEKMDIEKIATITSAQSIKENIKNKTNKENSKETQEVEVMDDGTSRVFNKKTMKDQFGNYPVWMNRRNIIKHKKGRAKTKKAHTQKDRHLTRKDKKKLREMKMET